jgi:hypothetical protein
MRRFLMLSLAVVLAGTVAANARLDATRSDGEGSSLEHLTPKARLAAIRHAQVWNPTDVPAMDLRAGPKEPDAFAPGETVTCDFVDKPMSGHSPKFDCAISAEDEVKVKYGQANGEVYAEVVATRLLWALGFGADRMYSVRLVCRKCPPDPARNQQPRLEEVVFDPAAIERKAAGKTMETQPDSGWEWAELDLVSEAAGGAPRAHRDALKLLAVFIQHTDNKPAQQRLVCLGKHGAEDGEPCPQTFMMINDLGLTFGRANVFNRNPLGSVNFEGWSQTAVWRDSRQCIGNLPKSASGTLEFPVVTEEGRKFLAGLLLQLRDAQLHDLFEVARFPLRSKVVGAKRGTTIQEWVDAFKHKRDEVVNRTCPS